MIPDLTVSVKFKNSPETGSKKIDISNIYASITDIVKLHETKAFSVS